MIYGFSPGQAGLRASIARMNGTMLRAMHDSRSRPLLKTAGEAIVPFLLHEGHFQECDTLFNVNALAFYDYSETEVIKTVEALGWTKPLDTDGNSTNCLLNAYANRDHLQRYGFHPYAFEVSGLVRSGVIGREEGFEKLSNLSSDNTYRNAEARLGFEAPL